MYYTVNNEVTYGFLLAKILRIALIYLLRTSTIIRRNHYLCNCHVNMGSVNNPNFESMFSVPDVSHSFGENPKP